jgi:hypothetical protein
MVQWTSHAIRCVLEMDMSDLQTVIQKVQDTLPAELGDNLLAVYLFGSAARGTYVPDASDLDLLLVGRSGMTLASARAAFRPLWGRHAALLGHGPWVATRQDLEGHLALFPPLHRTLLHEARLLYGEPVLKQLSPPAPVDPLDEVANVAARAITRATALTPHVLPQGEEERLIRLLDRLARRFTESQKGPALEPIEALSAIHAQFRQLAPDLPQFQWRGTPPAGEAPALLPGCVAFYQRERHLIAVLEYIDGDVLRDVDWVDVSAAAAEAYARFGLATPWQLRLAASQAWVDSLYFQGFEHLWGADVLADLEVDRTTLLRQLSRRASEQRVEKVPMAYLTIEEADLSTLIHDTQNLLLNAGLRAELLARFSARPFDLQDWTPPGRGTPPPERVAAIWERWRELTAYYTRMWRGTSD